MTIQETTTGAGGNVTWDEAVAASAQAEHEATHAPRTYTEELPVKLSEADLADRARKAASARQRVAEYEAQKKNAADHWKAKIELAENERDELLDTIASGVEERNVEVLETFEFRTGTVTITRADTGEKIRERAMTQMERQPSLPGTGAQMPLGQDDGEPSLEEAIEVLRNPGNGTKMTHGFTHGPLHEPGAGEEAEITDPDGVLGEATNADSPKAKRSRTKKP